MRNILSVILLFFSLNFIFVSPVNASSLDFYNPLKKPSLDINGKDKDKDSSSNPLKKPSLDVNGKDKNDSYVPQMPSLPDLKNPFRPAGTDMSVFEGNPLETKEATLIKGIVLVNKKNPLPVDYIASERELTFARGMMDSMINDAKNFSHSIVDFSGHRTYDRQSVLFNNYIKGEKNKGLSESEAIKKAETYSARPGFSEHQTGLTFDINDTSVGSECYFSDCGNTAAMKWVRDNAHEYGYILRYTKENQHETGYVDEFWHFRYIGKEHAKKYKSGGYSSLEKYLFDLSRGNVNEGDKDGESDKGDEDDVGKGSGSVFNEYDIEINNIGVNKKEQMDKLYLESESGKIVGIIILFLNILSWILSILIFGYISILWLLVILARGNNIVAEVLLDKFSFGGIKAYEGFNKLIVASITSVVFISFVISGYMPLLFAFIYKLLSDFISLVFML